MENAVDKKVLAKRSRTMPIIIFVIGTSLLGGAIFYTTQLAATRDKAFMLTFTLIFYLASAVMFFFSVRSLCKRKIAAEADEAAVYLYFGGNKKPPVAISYDDLADCRMSLATARSYGNNASRTIPLFFTFSFGTLYVYTKEKTYTLQNIAHVRNACISVRNEMNKHKEKAR